MSLLTISIPNLNEEPYSIQPVVLNNKTYYFEYFWNIRHGKAYFSIYILSNNIKTYLLRNRLLTTENILSKYILNNNDNWSGLLSFESKTFSNFDYTQENISSDYYLNYAYGDNTTIFVE